MKKKKRTPTKHSGIARDLRTPKYRMKIREMKRRKQKALDDLAQDLGEEI